MRLRRGEIRIEGLGKRYWFRSSVPESSDVAKTYDEDEAEDGGAQHSFASLLRPRAQVWALRDLFCHIEPGQHIAVIGPNGAGKTTLIRILARTLPPSKGTVEGAGTILPFDALAGPISEQQTGCDNLRMLARLLGLPLQTLEEHLPDIIEFSELGSLAYEKVFRYSAKSFARLSIAMALCIEADIYLIDDGLSGVDHIYQRKVRERLQNVLARNRTLIFASNNVREMEIYCKRALWLDGGKLVADGDFDSIVQSYCESRKAGSPNAADQSADEEPLPVAAKDPELEGAKVLPIHAASSHEASAERSLTRLLKF